MVAIVEDVWGIGIGQGGMRTWYNVNEQLLVSICMIDRRRVALYVQVLLDSSLTRCKVWGSAEARLHGMLALLVARFTGVRYIFDGDIASSIINAFSPLSIARHSFCEFYIIIPLENCNI